MARPDRVVILNDFSSTKGGAGYLADALARAIGAKGTAVTFIAGDSGTAEPAGSVERIALDGAPLLDGRASKAAMRGLYNRAAAAKLRAWIAQNDTPRTVYHLHNWSNILSPSVFDALAPVAARCVIHAHDFFLACPNGAYLDYPRNAVCTRRPLSMGCIATQCDKRAYAHKLWRTARQKVLFSKLAPHLKAATFVMINPAMRPWLNRAIQPAHITTIANPVTPFGPITQAPEAQKGIAHIGQVQRLKGVHDLAEAGRRVGAAISFFGDGEDLDALRIAYPEHHWHGHTPRDEIARHLMQMRAAVVGSQSPEPFCLAAYESVATGLPLILSDAILAADDLMQQGVATGFHAGDVDDLTRTLARILEDDALVAQLGAAARAKGQTLGHALPEWADAHNRLYERIITGAAMQLPDAVPAAPKPRFAGQHR
ncbi:glycosyltransferase family 4 protein [Yoonia sp. BS5-3]|uniref:Glycosyltransferase family 4 protein n=1 Tax=Yoonia phaeophyticola TaxID=3137369 RepID=A0ABZ2V5T7_9RHOB